MKKILFIHQSAELYGSDKTLLIFLKNVDKNKFFPVVILPGEGLLKEELEKLNIKVIVAPILKLYRNMFSFNNLIKFVKDAFSGFSIINKLHKEYQFDIVYSNTLAVLIGAFFARFKGITHIWHVHEIIEHPKSIAWLFPKLLYYFSDTIICNSEATKKNIVEREKRNIPKTIVIHNGIEVTENVSSAIKEDFGFHKNDVVITLIGRISRLKGHGWLLQTFVSELKEMGGVKLLFVGSPVPGQEFYLDDIEQFIKRNELENFVTIVPFTPKLNDIWNITDIAVMPSTEKESFGLVAVEAMLAKKPVVGSDHGGLKEIIVNEETGFLVEPNNTASLANALKLLIQNPELREQMGKKGGERMRSDFSAEQYVASFENMLQKS